MEEFGGESRHCPRPQRRAPHPPERFTNARSLGGALADPRQADQDPRCEPRRWRDDCSRYETEGPIPPTGSESESSYTPQRRDNACAPQRDSGSIRTAVFSDCCNPGMDDERHDCADARAPSQALHGQEIPNVSRAPRTTKREDTAASIVVVVPVTRRPERSAGCDPSEPRKE